MITAVRSSRKIPVKNGFSCKGNSTYILHCISLVRILLFKPKFLANGGNAFTLHCFVYEVHFYFKVKYKSNITLVWIK